MSADTKTVGFTMGARAGDTRLPHEAAFSRRLEQERTRASSSASHPGVVVEGAAATVEGEYEKEAEVTSWWTRPRKKEEREASLGCPACRTHPAEICPECSGWLHRAHGSAPACQRASCPGYTFQPWVQVKSMRARTERRSVAFNLSTGVHHRQAGAPPSASRRTGCA